MEVAPPRNASNNQSVASADMDIEPIDLRSRLQRACALMDEHKIDLRKSAVKGIAKMLQKILKNPQKPKPRKLALKKILVKKFIVQMPGGVEFMQSLGFNQTEQYLELADADVNVDNLNIAIAVLDDKVEAIESEMNQPPSQVRKLCKAGCGFFGAQQTDWYCSVCYNKKFGLSPEDSKEERKATPPAELRKRWKKLITAAKILVRLDKACKPKQTNKKRCWQCNRKVGVHGFVCRCGYVFCGGHRLPADHKCRFDFRRFHRNVLAKQNPNIRSDRMDKI